MKNLLIVLLSWIVILVNTSCKKDLSELPKAEIDPIDSCKLFLQDVISDNPSNYYISGEFDGYKIYCSSTFGDLFPANDTTFNAIYSNSSTLDNIHLLRENNDQSIIIALYLTGAKIFTRQFPYCMTSFNMARAGSGEFAELEVLNLIGHNAVVSGASSLEYRFNGLTGSPLKVNITSFTENIMEGTFEGSISTTTGSTIIVKNGKFRIKVISVSFN